jgi:hypothetical protein
MSNDTKPTPIKVKEQQAAEVRTRIVAIAAAATPEERKAVEAIIAKAKNADYSCEMITFSPAMRVQAPDEERVQARPCHGLMRWKPTRKASASVRHSRPTTASGRNGSRAEVG